LIALESVADDALNFVFFFPSISLVMVGRKFWAMGVVLVIGDKSEAWKTS